jgi:flagellar basal body-associated protein FliL
MVAHKERIIIIVLAVLLLVAAGYIGYAYVAGMQQNAFSQGAQYGYSQSVVDLLKQASTCQEVPVRYQNLTLNMVAVECLQRAQQQQQAAQGSAPAATQPTSTVSTS